MNKIKHKLLDPISEEQANEIRRQEESPMDVMHEGPIVRLTISEIIEKYGDTFTPEEIEALKRAIDMPIIRILPFGNTYEGLELHKNQRIIINQPPNKEQ